MRKKVRLYIEGYADVEMEESDIEGLLARLDDMRRVKRTDPKFEENMGDWYVNEGGVCTVCLAGAVIHGIIQTAPSFESNYLSPYRMGADTQEKLFAINDMRTGYFGGAWMGYLDVKGRESELETIFGEVRKQFNTKKGRAPYRVYQRAVENLRAAGL